MKRHALKKLNRAMRRTFTLLLSALVLGGSAFEGNAKMIVSSELNVLQSDSGTTYEDYLKQTYGDDWQAVAALQPGDSYISGDTMYVCYEEIYVDWSRVRSADDLDPSGWGKEEHLLMITDRTGYDLYMGNDYANTYTELGGKSNQVVLMPKVPGTKRRVVSGITKDTSGDNVAEYVDEYVYPELIQFASEKLSINSPEYPYPDTFRTSGTMNAPYIEYMGLDADNGNQRKFNIIMSKDDGTKSAIALSHDDSGDRLQLKAVSECTGFTFHMEGGKLRIFENIEDDDDLQLRIGENGHPQFSRCLYGRSYETLGEMKYVNEFVLFLGKKSVGKRIETISLGLDDAEQNPEALENVYGGAIEFYHWEKITSASQLPTDDGTYRALIAWNDKYFLQGDDFSERSVGGGGMALHVNEENTDRGVKGNVAEVQEIDLSQDEFYTMGGLGTPYLTFVGFRKEESYDNCPSYFVQLAGLDDQPSEKWLCDGDNKLDICTEGAGVGHYGGMNMGIVVGKELSSGNDASPGKVKLFFVEGGSLYKDTGFGWYGNVLYGDDFGGSWNYDEFTLYIGKPVVYPAVRQNYVVGEDQFMHISQNGAMLKNVTITVAKGGVLSIESWFMNNGRIVVDGGTLIVQNGSNPLGNEEDDDTEDSVLLPFADIHPTVSGSLELKNGGELIVLSNARAAFSNIKATAGSSILNNGLLLAETLNLQESTLENRKGMDLFVGYDFREIQAFRNSAVSKVIDDLTSRLNSEVASVTLGKNSAIINDGSIRYSTSISGSATVAGNATVAGSGSYSRVRGKLSRYMLSK